MPYGLPSAACCAYVLMCFMLAILQNVSSLFTYDRQTLLGIKGITEELLHDCITLIASGHYT